MATNQSNDNGEEASAVVSSTVPAAGLPNDSAPAPIQPVGEEEEDDERMDMAFIQGFADKIQRLPIELSEGLNVVRPKITIPKRGEKDFEPLQETVNLQEMMLQSSRQALFDALQGVRGVGSKALSHAIITPASPFPQLIVSRGHVLDTLGITVRRPQPYSHKILSRVELLPEEALYLSERGTLQIWNGRDPENAEEAAAGLGSWCDEEFGVKGAVEMSVMEVFGRFMGAEDLSWQRYQAYSCLKRLGYTVQRTRRFIPAHFLTVQPHTLPHKSETFLERLLASPLRWTASGTSFMGRIGMYIARLGRWMSDSVISWGWSLPNTALNSWGTGSYASIFAHLRFIPAGHQNPVPRAPSDSTASSRDPLQRNPYLPFFHVWKPVTHWSKVKWDRGSAEGIAIQRPDYALAVVESRDTPLPTLEQLNEVFDMLPDEPKGPVRRIGPQYERKAGDKVARLAANRDCPSLWDRFTRMIRPSTAEPARVSVPMNALRNGDRALIVAVNDSGNTGWVRFGRTGFESVEMA